MQLAARAKLREFVRELLANKNDTAAFADSDLLLTSGRLDSLATTEIVAFLEQLVGELIDADERCPSLHYA